MTRRARLTQEFGRVASRTNCSGRTCFASFTPAMCPASTQVAWRRAEATTHCLSFIGCDCVCLTSSGNHQSLTPSELQRNFPRVSPQKACSSILPHQPVVFTLHTSHFTLHSLHSKLHTPHFTLHISHFSLLTASFTLQTSHFTLHSSRSTLHTALFTLHISSHLSSSHLIPAHLFSSSPFSYVIY